MCMCPFFTFYLEFYISCTCLSPHWTKNSLKVDFLQNVFLCIFHCESGLTQALALLFISSVISDKSLYLWDLELLHL